MQRYVCWMHTTPTILLLVKMISSTITKQQVRGTPGAAGQARRRSVRALCSSVDGG